VARRLLQMRRVQGTDRRELVHPSQGQAGLRTLLSRLVRHQMRQVPPGERRRLRVRCNVM